jgi:hypothetical protein
LPTDCGEVVSHKLQPLLIPKDDSCYSFLFETESTLVKIAAGRSRCIENKFSELFGNRTRDLLRLVASSCLNQLRYGLSPNIYFVTYKMLALNNWVSLSILSIHSDNNTGVPFS